MTHPFTQFPGNSAIGQDDYPDEKAVEFGRVTAREMKLVGLNMDLAPVVDVKKGEPEKHLRGRVFGDDPDKVGRLGSAVIRSLQDNGIMAVAKHFPGLGLAEMQILQPQVQGIRTRFFINAWRNSAPTPCIISVTVPKQSSLWKVLLPG